MSNAASNLGDIVKAMRPVVPAKDYETSKRFYLDLGFRPRQLGERLFEMQLGTSCFILQDYYVEDWANNFVMHVLVTDLDRWWQHISRLDLHGRYGVKTLPPKQESWGMVAGVVDPCGVLWRFTQAQTS
jgi:Glyoxalase/Bleomycin resistance protein/Dioxygenase superfamily